MSYNGNAFYVVTSEDLTGVGSQKDPYVVYSTKGFWYLTNYSLSKLVVSSKYIQIQCDIILNDEKFNESGDASGGDGKVYSWKPASGIPDEINGNYNALKGLYYNSNATTAFHGILFSGQIVSVKNLDIENVYIKAGRNTGALASGITGKIENCTIKSGFLSSSGHYIGGFACGIRGTATNCSNYATINGNAYIGGLFAIAENATLNYCKNYGIINAASNSGGIVGLSDKETNTFKNCENYGEILSSEYKTGGILGRIEKGFCQLLNCNNYGNLRSLSNLAGAFVGTVFGENLYLLIESCNNYGEFYSNNTLYSMGFVGYLQKSPCIIDIINCYSNTKEIIYFVAGYQSSSIEGTILNVQDCKIVQTEDSSRTGLLFVQGNYARPIQFNIKNTMFDIRSKTFNYELFLSNYNTGYLYLNIENLYVKADCESYKSKNLITNTTTTQHELKINGLVFDINEKGVQKGCYYGDDFSQYYFSWRTGQIGLVTLDGRGSFQGKIDEEWLKNKGFEKKII